MPYRSRIGLALAIVLTLACTTAGAAPAYYYTVSVIGNGSTFDPSAINSMGQGASTDIFNSAPGTGQSPATRQALIWNNGNIQYFQAPAGDMYGGAINNNGVATGAVSGRTPSQVAMLNSSTNTPLATGAGTRLNATIVNNAGQVAITADFHGYLLSQGGAKTDLGNIGFGGATHGLNDSGAVVGKHDTADGFHAFVYENGQLKDLGVLGGRYSEAYAINDAGIAVGWSSLATSGRGSTWGHAAMFGPSGVVDLGALGGTRSEAYSINDLGQVVGVAATASGLRGFLYENGAMADLNTYIDPASGWTVGAAVYINDAGQILAEACDRNGAAWQVLLSPARISPVPEPASCAALLAGLVALGLGGRRERARSDSTKRADR